MSWIVFKTTSSTSSGRELVLPKLPENRSIRFVDHDPRHFGESLEAVVAGLRPGSGYEYECYQVDDQLYEATAYQPPTPAVEVIVAKA